MGATWVVSNVEVRRKNRVTFGITTEARSGWYPVDGFHLSSYEVEAPTKAEAPGIVMRWLAQGRPRAMEVQQLFPRVQVQAAVGALSPGGS